MDAAPPSHICRGGGLPPFKADRDLVLAAIAQEVEALKYTDPAFKTDCDIFLATVALNGRVFDPDLL